MGAIRVRHVAPLLAMVLTCRSPSEPGAPPLPAIVFMVETPTWPELYSVDPTDSEMRPLTNNVYEDLNPNWYDQHQRIAFGSSRNPAGLYSFRPDGSDLTRIHSMTNYPIAGRFAVSPDGKMLAISTYSDDVRIVAIGDTAAPKRIGRGSQPAWSPDSKHLAYRYEDGIVIMRIDPEPVTSLVLLGSGITDPSWSPDGTRLAFSKAGNVGYRAIVLHTVRIDGTDSRQITWPLPDQDMLDLGSVWSPDGRFIAFQREALCVEEPGRVCIDIMVVPSEGGEVRLLTGAAPPSGQEYYKRMSMRPTW